MKIVPLLATYATNLKAILLGFLLWLIIDLKKNKNILAFIVKNKYVCKIMSTSILYCF